MKNSIKHNIINSTLEVFSFNTLSNEEMSEVRGGTRPKPKSRDKDVYDFDEE